MDVYCCLLQLPSDVRLHRQRWQYQLLKLMYTVNICCCVSAVSGRVACVWEWIWHVAVGRIYVHWIWSVMYILVAMYVFIIKPRMREERKNIFAVSWENIRKIDNVKAHGGLPVTPTPHLVLAAYVNISTLQGKKNCTLYFGNNFVKPHCILTIFWHTDTEVNLQQNCNISAPLSWWVLLPYFVKYNMSFC